MIRRPAPLRPGLAISLVQRPRRKAHAATIRPGDPDWVAFCGRSIPAAGTGFVPAGDVPAAVEEHADDLCADCYHLLAFAALVADAVLADVAAARRIS